MAKSVKGARFVPKRTDVLGATPTVPPNNDHTSGWLDTDIYKGEIFINIADSKMWFRNISDDMVQLVPVKENGKIDSSYLPGDMTGRMTYKGVWDPSSGKSPTGSPEKGDYYVAISSSDANIDGVSEWAIGDFAVFNGTKWDKVSNSTRQTVSEDVAYSNENLPNVKNTKEVLDYLLTTSAQYKGGNNVEILKDSDDRMSVAVVKNPSFAGSVTIGEQLTVEGKILSDGGISAGEVSSPVYHFDSMSTRISGDGRGIHISYNGELKLDIGGDASITTSYNKLRYNGEKTLDNRYDVVPKGYVDSLVEEQQKVIDGLVQRIEEQEEAIKELKNKL